MAEIKDGGPAFPTAPYYDEKPLGVIDGMSLRDYFAAKALAGCATSAGYQGLPWDSVARECYRAADEMLKAREQA